MNKFNLKRYAQESPGIELEGTLLSVYHRTGSNDVANLICETGFLAGGGAAWGVGIYSNYTWSGVTRNAAMDTYGAVAVKGKMNINDFLIFDYSISKGVYGSNYRLIDQVKKLGLDRSLYRDKMGLIQNLSNSLERMSSNSITSNLLRQIWSPQLTGIIKGVIFSGNIDKNVALAYDSSVVYPVGFIVLDQRTVKNPRWSKCSVGSIESAKKLYQAYISNNHEEVDKQRDILFHTLSPATTNQGYDPKIKLSYEKLNLLPREFIDNVVSMMIIKSDNPLILKALEGQLREKMLDSEYLEFEIIKRQFFSSPLVYWDNLKKHSSFKSIARDSIIDAFQSYIEQHPFDWENVPNDAKGLINKEPLMKYFESVISQNRTNIKNIPEEFIEILKSSDKLSRGDLKYYENSKSEYLKNEFVSEEFEIPFAAIGWLESGIDKLNKKGFKLGLAPSKIEILEDNIVKGTKKIRILKSVPVIPGGWELAAKINLYKTDTGDIESDMINLGRREVPEQYMNDTSQLTCDHCHVNRYRTGYYILYDKNSGNYKCVGSSCLSEFLPGLGLDAEKLAQYAAEMEQYIHHFKKNMVGSKQNSDDITKSYNRNGIPLPFFLSRVHEITKKGNYVSRKSAYESNLTATADEAFAKCFQDLSDNETSLDIGDIPFVNAIIDWIQTLSDSDNQYLRNLYDASSSGFVTRKNVGILTSAVPSYYRNLKDSTINKDKLLGANGDKIYFSGSIIEKSPVFVRVSTDGYSTGDYFFVAEDGKSRKIMFSGSSVDFPEFESLDKGESINCNGIIVDLVPYDADFCTIIKIDSILDQIDANILVEQEKKIEKIKGGIKEPVVYKDGMKISDDFTVSGYKVTSRGSYFVQLEDGTGQRLSLFLNSKPTFNVRDIISVSGSIKLNNGYINIVNPSIAVDGNEIKTLESVYNVGDRITTEGTIIEIYSVYNNYNNSSFDKAKIKDASGFVFDFTVPAKNSDIGVGDFVNVTGKLEGVYGASGKLTRPKINSVTISNIDSSGGLMLNVMDDNDKQKMSDIIADFASMLIIDQGVINSDVQAAIKLFNDIKLKYNGSGNVYNNKVIDKCDEALLVLGKYS